MNRVPSLTAARFPDDRRGFRIVFASPPGHPAAARPGIGQATAGAQTAADSSACRRRSQFAPVPMTSRDPTTGSAMALDRLGPPRQPRELEIAPRCMGRDPASQDRIAAVNPFGAISPKRAESGKRGPVRGMSGRRRRQSDPGLSGACTRAAEMVLSPATERWPSGRRRTPGKCVGGEPSRGFESLSLRQPPALPVAAPLSAPAARRPHPDNRDASARLS